MSSTIRRSPSSRLAVIQVDGLSETHLKQALKRGLMPNLKERVDNGSLKVDSYRTGLPSQTTVAIGGLLYGEMLPGNQWYDKETQAVVDTFSLGHAAKIAADLGAKGTGIAAGGSVYLSPLDGGADSSEAHFVSSDLSRVKQSQGTGGLIRTAALEFGRLMRHLVTHPVKAVQSAVHFGVEMAHDLKNRKTTGRSLKVMVGDAFKETLIADASSHRIADQIREGKAPFLYVDLANFDAKNHVFGPGEEAFNSLPAVDRNLDTILDAWEQSKTPYDIAILADHGSARSYHFHEIYGKSLEQVAQNLAPDNQVISLDFGSGAHVYLKDQPGELSRSQLPKGLVEGLRDQPGVAFTVTRDGESTLIEGRHGQVRVSGSEIKVEGENPIAPFEEELDLVARQLHDMAHRDKVGDIMVFGENHKDGLIDFSTSSFQGLHGGIGHDQTKPFVAWNSGLKINPSEVESAAELHQQFRDTMT